MAWFELLLLLLETLLQFPSSSQRCTLQLDQMMALPCL